MTAKTKATERRNPATSTRCDKTSVPTDTAAPSADSFNAKREGHGTKEWSDKSHNIQKGCKHGCLYCYAKANAIRRKQVQAEDWTTPKNNGSFEKKGQGFKAKSADPSRRALVMFPSTHDITPDNQDDCLKTIQNLLVNNDVLVVSKPHLSVVKALCRGLEKQKAHILFRFTIGSLDEELSKEWEPGAPSPRERLAALKYANEQGFRTSVSMEPMLAGRKDAIKVVNAVMPYVTKSEDPKKAGTIWLGKMNNIPHNAADLIKNGEQRLKKLKEQQCDFEILLLVNDLENHPASSLVKWKDSIKKVLSSTIAKPNMADLPALVRKLEQAGREVDKWLAAGLSVKTKAALADPDTKAALAKHKGRIKSTPKPTSTKTTTATKPTAKASSPQCLVDLQATMLADINKLVRGPSLHTNKRFAGVGLREETKSLLKQELNQYDRQLLNRLLLEDAYPLEVSRQPQKVKVQLHVRKLKAAQAKAKVQA